MLDNFLGPLLIVIFIILQVMNSRNIIIKTQFSKIKAILSLLISIGVIVMFWTNEFKFLTILFSVSILIITYGLLPEGLTKDGVARFGILDGSYSKYEKIEMFSLNNKNIFLSFYSKGSESRRKRGYRSGASFTFRFPENVSEDNIISFFKEIGVSDIVEIHNERLQLKAQ